MDITIVYAGYSTKIDANVEQLEKSFFYFENMKNYYNDFYKINTCKICPTNEREKDVMIAILLNFGGKEQDLTKFEPKLVIDSLTYFLPKISLFMLLPREMDQYFLEVTEYLPFMNDVDISYYLCLITKYKQVPSDNNTLVFLIKFLEKTQLDYIALALKCFNDMIITSNEAKVKKMLFTEEMTQTQNIYAYQWMFGKVFIKCLCNDSLRAISLLDNLSEQHTSYLEQLYQDTFTPEMKEIAKNNSKVFYKFKILDLLFESQQIVTFLLRKKW